MVSVFEEHHPLPSAPSDWLPGTQVRNAYERCLEYELRGFVETEPLNNISRFTPLISARELGYLLLFAPNDGGRAVLSSEIMSCTDDAALLDLAKQYNDNLIRFCQHFHHTAFHQLC
jgi:hypothetical protein